eukprot:scpid90803/ scgid20540/ 
MQLLATVKQRPSTISPRRNGDMLAVGELTLSTIFASLTLAASFWTVRSPSFDLSRDVAASAPSPHSFVSVPDSLTLASLELISYSARPASRSHLSASVVLQRLHPERSF